VSLDDSAQTPSRPKADGMRVSVGCCLRGRDEAMPLTQNLRQNTLTKFKDWTNERV
jgi:hypothetical protein